MAYLVLVEMPTSIGSTVSMLYHHQNKMAKVAYQSFFGATRARPSMRREAHHCWGQMVEDHMQTIEGTITAVEEMTEGEKNEEVEDEIMEGGEAIAIMTITAISTAIMTITAISTAIMTITAIWIVIIRTT